MCANSALEVTGYSGIEYGIVFIGHDVNTIDLLPHGRNALFKLVRIYARRLLRSLRSPAMTEGGRGYLIPLSSFSALIWRITSHCSTMPITLNMVQ